MTDQSDRTGVNRRNFLTSASAVGLSSSTLATGTAKAEQQQSVSPPPTSPMAPPSEAQLAQEFDPLEDYPEELIDRYFVERPASDFMVDVMRAFDIEYLAINAASSFRGLHESVLNYGNNEKPQILTCLHEEQAVALAHGYYKVSGKPMAMACHGTVGLQHAAMAVYNAWVDQVPMILIGGNHMDAATRRVPVEWLHAAQDAARPIRDFIKWDDTPVSLTHFAESFARAYRIALTPPMGPVALVLDADLQEQGMGDDIPPVPKVPSIVPPRGDDGAVRAAADMLVTADSPVLLADRAIHTEAGMALLVELAEILQAPVVDKGGRMNFPNTHYLNHTLRSGAAVDDADVLLGLELSDVWGSINRMLDLPQRESASQVNPDVEVITIGLGDSFIKSNYQDFNRYYEPDLPILGDVEATLPSLIEAVRSAMSRSRRSAIARREDALRKAYNETRQSTLDDARYGWDASPVSTARICMEVWAQIKDRDKDWGLVSGVGFWGNWPRRLWAMDKPHHYIGTSGAGGLGYGISAAVGAALAHQEAGRIAVNLQSDGDMLYAPGALWTAAHHQVPLLTVMHNNRAYHQELMHVQRVAARRQRGVEGTAKIGNVFEDPPVDFATLAKSFGVWASGPIEDPNDVGPALTKAMDVVMQGEPALVDIVAQPR